MPLLSCQRQLIPLLSLLSCQCQLIPPLSLLSCQRQLASRIFIIISLLLSGCTTYSSVPPEARTSNANQLAKNAGWKVHSISTNSFTLRSYTSPLKQNELLTIFIEGDGLAWLSANMPSENPTPIVPTALKMAIHNQKKSPVAYLARPCQFVFNEEWKNCQTAYWTNMRFSSEIINATNEAVDKLKKYYHAKKIKLVGYSGGGTVAALVAARRNDVIQLITVAAILDVKKWGSQQSLTPLRGLDPADEWKKLVMIPQTHYVGDDDNVVSKEIALAFAQRFPLANKPEIRVIPNYGHTCCWATLDLKH